LCLAMREPAQREAAFRELHRRYGPKLLGFLAKLCRGDRDLAEDLLGRALHKAYLGLARMETPCRSLPSWLYTVAARTALDDFEKQSDTDPLRRALPLNEELVESAPEPGNGGNGERDREIDGAVEAVLERLEAEDARYRALLEMEHIGACDRGEIAAATGIPR